METGVQETKKCKHCQSDIPKKAKVCPVCKKKQGGKLKWIIIAVVVLGIIGVVSGGGGDSNNSDSKTSSQTNTNSESKQNTSSDSEKEKSGDEKLKVGDSFDKNGLKITVNEADIDFTNYKNDYGWNTPKDGMKYIMVSFTFENTGSSDAYVSIYDFDCYADNTTCEQVYSLDDNNFMNTNLSPGRNVSFKTYYTVPIDTKSIELEYETNIWTGKKVVITIQ